MCACAKEPTRNPPRWRSRAKSDVDANYIRLGCLLLDSPVYHGLATHDEAMIDAIKAYAAQHAIEPGRFEFQMLYGVRRDLQRKLVQEGYKVRVYVPFGTRLVPLLHAPAGRAACQRDLPGQKLLPLLKTHSEAPESAACSATAIGARCLLGNARRLSRKFPGISCSAMGNIQRSRRFSG